MSQVLSPRVVIVPSLQDAAREMELAEVSPGGIRAMAGKCRTLVIKVVDADVPTAHILKQQMLSLGGDAAVAKDVLVHGVDSTDVLLIGTHVQMRELTRKLGWQPFGLPELGEKIAALLDTVEGTPRGVVRARRHELRLGERAHIMAVLNVTPDSFSDGGEFLQPSEALDHALRMADEGADIIDVGGQSSRPGSEPVSEEDELKRVVPVISRIAEEWKGPISVDTYRSRVAKDALEVGASMVNDITALSGDERMPSVIADSDAACVLMHMKGTPADMQNDPSYGDVVGEIAFFLHEAIERARAAGIADDRIMVDPGIGFGKTAGHNLTILRRLSELAVLDMPVVVGTSRKAFIGKVLDLPVTDRLEGTIATAVYAVAQGARVLRVHDVAPVSRAVRMVEACLSPPE
ncbi:MAG: dihydropteroate synthase [Candidatus Eisenbacteria bacterium]|nr:dihydropteroate synthase [Candidatus Eisenbacteria bacterium]